MKTTKIFILISLFLGALLLAGLFLFLKQSPSPKVATALKPGQLNFSQSNKLPEPAVPEKPVQTLASTQQISFKIENLNTEDKIKWFIFEDVLKSKNDNDLRLDQDLKKLSLPLHEVLYKKYEALPAEDHNGRGLIVYLIARDLKSNEDADFLKTIYQEAPCLSLADCKGIGLDDPHHSSVNQTTLVYAQMAGLYEIEKQIKENPGVLNNQTYRNRFIQILIQAENFPVAEVQDKARAIRTEFGL